MKLIPAVRILVVILEQNKIIAILCASRESLFYESNELRSHESSYVSRYGYALK